MSPDTQKTPPSPVSWNADGEPYSEAFGDVYHTSSGAAEQARQVFIQGVDLPARWANTPTHTVFETGFGLGLNFLTTWQTWQQDPQRCDRLHFYSVEAFPVQAADIIKASHNIPQLQPLAKRLADQYPVTLPGIYRLVFEEDNLQQVVLTLAFGEARTLLPQLCMQADSIFLDGFSPAKNPQLWESPIFKAIAKISAPGARIATWSVAGSVRQGLQAANFDVAKTKGLPPKRQALTGTFKPYPSSRRNISTQAGRTDPDKKQANEAIVIGAGIAGASVCWSLAQRGWQITLIDKASSPAQGASGLPMGLALPHISADDALISRLTRSGMQWLDHLITSSHLAPRFWKKCPIEQLLKNNQHGQNGPQIPSQPGHPLFDDALTDENQPCMRFHAAYQIEGAAFVQALLRHTPGLQYLWHTEIKRLEYQNQQWLLYDEKGQLCAQSPHVIVCTALNTFELCGLNSTGITPNRGQITLGIAREPHTQDLSQQLPQVRSGHGHFILPLRQDAGWTWSMGSTFDAGSTNTELLAQSHLENYSKLQQLSPATAKRLKPAFENGPLSGFVEIRCTSADHLPLLGAVPDLPALAQQDAGRLHMDDAPVLPGLFMLAALGSRGLTIGPWCAEILASMICREPWPATRPMVRAFNPARFEIKMQRSHLSQT